MKCRVKIAFGPYRVGDIIEPTGVYRDSLKARGLIEIIEPRAVECAVAAEPETAAIRTRTKRNTGGRQGPKRASASFSGQRGE